MRKIKILSIVLSAITFALSFNLCAGATTIEDFYKSTGDGNVAVLQETSDITETLCNALGLLGFTLIITLSLILTKKSM